MRRAAFAGSLGLLVLLGLVGLEWQMLTRDNEPMPIPVAPPAPADAPGRPAPPPLARQEEWARTILARPLFTKGRRPPAGPAPMAAAGAAPVSLPRLAGIMITGTSREALLVPAGSSKAVLVREGAEVAGFTVEAIRAGQVALGGPDGTRVLRPSFDPRLPAPQAAPGLPAGLPSAAMPPALPRPSLLGQAVPLQEIAR